MDSGGFTVEVTNLSPKTTEGDLYDFFSFSGAVEHIEVLRSGNYGCTAYVTFKEAYSVETAVLLTGATIKGQVVCIAHFGHNFEAPNSWDTPTLYQEVNSEFRADHFGISPVEAVTVTQDVVKTMIAKGYHLSKDALIKAKAFDESRGLSAAAAAKVAAMSRRIGLTDKINAGVDAVRSVDQSYHISDKAKTVAYAAGKAASTVATTVVNSSYFSAGAQMVSDALMQASQYTADWATHGKK